MKIALIHDFLNVYGGAERVLKELHILYPKAPIYTATADPKLIAEHFPDAIIHTSPLQHSWKRKVNALFLLNVPEAIESFNLTGYDVVISSSGAYSHGVITGPDTYHISYCHSPMRYVWDWHAEFLEEKGLNKGWLKPFIANQAFSKLRMWDAISAKRVDQWVANSKTVANRIAQYYRTESKIIYPPVDTVYFDPALIEKTKRGIQVFTVSRLTSAKKIDQIILACAEAHVPLHIAGTGDESWLRKIVADCKADVTFLGAVSEEVKRQELANASAFIFASEDDFGIAPVEAMAMGTPVIAFGKGGATETVLDGVTGLLYADQTVGCLAETLAVFRQKGVSGTPERIRTQALKFSTEKFANGIKELVDHHA